MKDRQIEKMRITKKIIGNNKIMKEGREENEGKQRRMEN